MYYSFSRFIYLKLVLNVYLRESSIYQRKIKKGKIIEKKQQKIV